MTNYLAIATVTAALKNILQTGIRNDLPGTQVTTVRPDSINNAQKERRINVYLYQTTLNKELQPGTSLNRRPRGEVVTRKAIRLDLHYLITFYGNELELESQQLLGSTIRTLLDYSTLNQEMIEEAISHSQFLADSSLSDQLQMIQFDPSPMTPDELSRMWSVMFQSPYTLSTAYVGKAVLIQGTQLGQAALPVRNTRFYLNPARPAIDKIEVKEKVNNAITANSQVLIYGKQLNEQDIKIQIGHAKFTPQIVEENFVKLDLSTLIPPETNKLRAGVQNLQIIQTKKLNGLLEKDRVVESNVMPFILSPTITSEISVINQQNSWKDLFLATLTFRVDLIVGKNQRVFLLMNQISNQEPEAYIFPIKSRKIETDTLHFSIRDIKAGDYLVRVQIDGAESPLLTNKNEEYYKPKVTIIPPKTETFLEQNLTIF